MCVDCSIICVGGDGTVNAVVDQLLIQQQTRNGVDMTLHLTPLRIDLKIGIIPTGANVNRFMCTTLQL